MEKSIKDIYKECEETFTTTEEIANELQNIINSINSKRKLLGIEKHITFSKKINEETFLINDELLTICPIDIYPEEDNKLFEYLVFYRCLFCMF